LSCEPTKTTWWINSPRRRCRFNHWRQAQRPQGNNAIQATKVITIKARPGCNLNSKATIASKPNTVIVATATREYSAGP